MIMADAVIGNIYAEMKSSYEEMMRRNAVEKLRITRMESERVRMRKATDMGTDVAMTLPAGSRLRHGDILALAERMVVVEIEPEKVAVVQVFGDARTAALVGHAIGNLHRPIRVEGDRIIFPIQSDDEMAMMQRQLASFADKIKITKDVTVFEPEVSSHGH